MGNNASRLPSVLVQTEENDLLRDEGEAYTQKVDAAGVPATATRDNGQVRDFGVLNGIRNVRSTKEAVNQASAVIKRHLNQ